MAVSTMSSTSSHVVRRRRSDLEAKMTCPLCNKLFEEATTISECLDTFCRKCIYDKIVDEELDSCPKCNAHLGVAPLEKLRPDNNWRTLRDKMFPPEKTKVEEQAVAPDPVSPKRKERLISSLTDTPRASSRSDKHRRKRHPTRRSIPAPDCTQSVEKQEKEEENFRERLKSPETPKNAPSTPQNFEEASSMQHMLHKGVQDGKADLSSPLNHPVDAEKTSPDIPVAAPALPDLPNIERLEIGETGDSGNDNESIPATSASRPPRKSQRVKKRDTVVADLNIPAPSVVAASTKSHISGAGFWFSLVTSNQDGYAPLPQIPSGYLRVKDGSLPVSYIKRYLVQKLNLTSEAEVEIFLRGQPVIPTLQLHNLADLWVRTTPTSQRVLQGSVGSSGKEYVMVLTYARKAQIQ